MKELGLSVDFSHHAPDFVLNGDHIFNIEARISNNAEEATPEHDLNYKLQKLKDPNPDFVMFKTLRYGKSPFVPVSELFLKKDYRETLLDGLHVFHNPYAENPLEYHIFDRPEVLQHSFDISSRTPIDDHKEGALIVRQVITNKSR